MAGIISHSGQSGLTTYAVIRNSSGEVWNGSTFETFTAANWSTYDVSLVEQGNSGYYKGNFPSGISAGVYSITLHSGSVTHGDDVIGSDSEYIWTGTERYTHLAFTSTHKSEINTEVLDVMNSDPMAELSGIPDAEPTAFDALMLIYMWLRNDTNATATLRTIKNSAGTAIGTSTMSDNGTTFSQGKLG